MSERKSGILLHVSSLSSKFGIGDLGPEAYRFVDFLYKTKQSFWQILPINPTDPISGHSPYSSLSAFAANVLYISPELLVEEKLLSKKEIDVKQDCSSTAIHFETVTSYKKMVLDRAYEHFVSDVSVRKMLQTGFNDFISANAFWIEDYALFATIKNHFKGTIWTDWPEVLRDRDNTAMRDFVKAHEDEIEKIKFFQYLFFKQWGRLKEYCVPKSVHLIGDMSIYMNFDSADVWRYPQNYKLNDQLKPSVVAGVPPDYFSETGQRWGNPIYNWDILKQSEYTWWIERFKLNFRLFDTVRIDHFRGLVQCWEIPSSEETAVKGQWADVPTDDFFKALENKFSVPLPIIAEDLGYITEDVRQAMHRFSFPGMKVLLFAFNGNMDDHPYLPHNYAKHCVVYTGTHDNNTVLGWWINEASGQELKNVKDYLKNEITKKNVHWKFIRMAFDSEAELALVPMQDVLGLGSEARMNTPGTNSNENWRWRVPPDAFSKNLIKKLSDMTVESKRG